MKLFECTMLDDAGYTDTIYKAARSEEEAREHLFQEICEDDYMGIIVKEIKIDGYKINIEVNEEGVSHLVTDGWYIKAGDAYTSPMHYAHLLIDRIILSDNGDPSDAIIIGEWVNPFNHKQKMDNDGEYETRFRAWHLNESYSPTSEIPED